MQLTLTEMHFLADYCERHDQHSLFKTIKPARGEGNLKSLENKGVFVDGQLSEGSKALLKILSEPERVAHFQLQQLEVNMRKRVYVRDDERILVEFKNEFVMISTFDSEVSSVRAEIINHIGASFQKHSLLKQVFNGEELLCFAALADWLRRVALSELTGQKSVARLDVDQLAEFVKSPLKLGVLSQVMALTHLKVPDYDACLDGLKGLMKKGLVERVEPTVEIGKSTILFGINFLVPNMTISLELYDLADTDKVVTAREMVIWATPKDAISLSANAQGYHAESVTSGEVLEKIIAYLSSPSLRQASMN